MKFAKIKIFLKQLKSNFALWREVKQQRGRRLQNVTLKVKSRCVKPFRAYSFSFNSSNIGIFFWIEF